MSYLYFIKDLKLREEVEKTLKLKKSKKLCDLIEKFLLQDESGEGEYDPEVDGDYNDHLNRLVQYETEICLELKKVMGKKKYNEQSWCDILHHFDPEVILHFRFWVYENKSI